MKEKIVNKKRKPFIKIFCDAICLILCISQVIFLFSPTILAASSELRNSKYEVDQDTTDDYISHLINDENGSRYAGRVWSDKSVFRESITLDKETDGYTGTITNNSDFLHVFSALGSSQAWIGLPPARTIIVIDNSASMYKNSKEWEETRSAHTVEATNKAIDSLMRASQYNEIAVVLFGDGSDSWYNNGSVDKTSASTAKVIIPMGHYPISNSPDEPYQYLQSGWNVSKLDQESKTTIQEIPDTPLHDPKEPNITQGKGTVYVDKMYVNKNFTVDTSYESKSGKERFDLYTNDTTNIQAGFHAAFQELLKGKKEVNVGGYTFGYLPKIVMLTDGAATDMLKGTYSNPTLESRGFTNDRGTKLASYVGVFHESNVKNTSDWNMYTEIINKNGVETFEQLGYGDGTLSEGLTVGTFTPEKDIDKWSTKAQDMDPGEEGLKGMQKFAEDVRSTQGAMLLSTLLMVAYEKAIIAKEYGSECDIYTISVDIANPEDFDLDPQDEFAKELKSYSSSAATMNPNKYFNLEWLQEDGFINADADLANLTEDDLAFKPYTVGSELIMSLDAAIKAWEEIKSGSVSTEARDKLKTYLAYSEFTGLYTQMKTGKVTYNDKEYTATVPVGPDHGNAYLIRKRYNDITYPNLQKGDKVNNPYDLSIEDLDINYVTKAFYPKSVDETHDSIASAFDEIVQNIKEPAFVPTHDRFAIVDNLIYSDPIGKYMEVKDVKNLLLFGKLYEINKTDLKYVTKSGENEIESSVRNGKYNYIRQYYKVVNDEKDELINNCYKIIDESDEFDSVVTYKLSDIKIYVDTNLNAGPLENDQTLYVEIPATALPLQVVTIKLNPDGSSAYYKTNIENKEESTPLRLFYEVGLSDDIKMNNGKDIDLDKIDEEYLKKYTTEGDYLNFFSNYYSETTYDGYTADTQDDSRTKGDAFLTLSPSMNNRYYIFQKNLKLYTKAYKVENNELKELSSDEAKNFEGHAYYGELNSKEELQEKMSKGLKEGDIVTLKTDVATYENKEKYKSDSYFYIVVDYYMPTKEDKGEQVQYIVSRKGSEFGSGLLNGGLPKGDFLCWYDESGKNPETYDYDQEVPKEKLGDGSNWVLATKIGGLRIGDLHQSILRKKDNKTNTSKSYYLPIIADDPSTIGSDAILDAYLGNNGLLTYKIEKWEIPATGSIGTIIVILLGITLIILSSLLYKRQKRSDTR